jgi:hypothetical protein
MAIELALSLKFRASRVDVAQGGDSVYSDGSWKAGSDIATSEVPLAPPKK